MKKYGLKSVSAKLAALILCLSVVVSAFSGSLSTLALSSSDITIYTDESRIPTDYKVDFEGLEVKYHTPDGYSPTYFDDNDKIYDYNLSTASFSVATGKAWVKYKDGCTGSSSEGMNGVDTFYKNDIDRYCDLTLTVQSEINVKDIIVKHHPNAMLTTQEYSIYASANKETLFDDSSKLYDYTQPTSGVQALQDFKFKDGSLTGVKYIGMRIQNPATDWESIATIHGANAIYLRLFEFNVYGTYVDPDFKPDVEEMTVYSNFDKVNTIKEVTKSVKTNFTKDGKEASAPLSPESYLTDGDISKGAEIMSNDCLHFDAADGYSVSDKTLDAIGTIYNDGSRYATILLKAITDVDIKDITLAFHSNTAFKTSKFAVFASGSLGDLYEDENIIFKSEKNSQQVFDFHFNDGYELEGIKYVALRIYDPSGDWRGSDAKSFVEQYGANILCPRIMEFNFYGSYSDPDYAPRVLIDTKDYDLSKIPLFGDNMIRNVLPSIYENGTRVSKTQFLNRMKTAASTVPNNDVIHQDMDLVWNGEGDYIDIQFKFNTGYELTKVNGFAYQGMCRDMSELYARKYQVFVAEDAEDLFTGEPVFTYDADEDGLLKGVIYEFPKGKQPKGNYFGFRLLEPYNINTTLTKCVRFSFLYVWGEEADIQYFQTNLAENMPITPSFEYNGKYTEVSEENLTATETANMTDNSASTVANINTKGEKRDKLNLTYNLCGDTVVDKLSFSLPVNSTTGFKKMKVYASSSLTAVNNEESLIWTYTPTASSGTLTPSKNLSLKDEVRYVRISFEGTKDYVQIGTVNIEGSSRYKNKTRTITSSLDYTAFEFHRISANTNKQTFVEYSQTVIDYLYDGDADTCLCFHAGSYEDSVKIQIDLGNLRTVSKIDLSFVKYFENNRPGKVKLYSAETDDQLDDMKLIAEFDVNSDNLSKQYRPFLSRYITVVMSDNKKDDSYQLPDGTYQLATAISEIKIIGTNVKGMQTAEDNEVMLTYKDNKSGISVDICRLDINDVFTDVAGIKVTPSKATNWQMRSLEKEPYLKILDKQVYKIEFLDLYGNKVTNLNNRKIQLRYSPKGGTLASDIMFGDAAERTKISAIETMSTATEAYTDNYEWKADSDNVIALLVMTTSDDKYWDSIGELEDFSEGDKENVTGETHDAEWYKTIRTDDGLFEVSGADYEIDEGVKFTATDIADTASDGEYQIVLQVAGGKKVAAFFDMNLTLNGEDYDYQGVVDIKFNLPEYITDNYTDLQVIHISEEDNTVYLPWCETSDTALDFQTDSFSHFAIVGTALDGSTSIDDGTGNTSSPVTGETANTAAAIILIMTAAAFVILSSSAFRKAKNR